jgi:aryl-alcohol dehydrogenase-like predicted oxidoreductase
VNVRNLGSAGLASSAVGLGTAVFSGIYGPVSKHECIRTIQLALDIGVTMVDTADFYADGEIERMVGLSLSGRRDKALIATHGGVRGAYGDSFPVIDGSPKYLAEACDASLKRLGTDYIDLFYLTRIDPQIPVEESVGKLAELTAAGKIRYLGLCDASADEIRRAQATHSISTIAVNYSVQQRAAEKSVLAAAAELGVGVVAYCPLARGLLTGGRRPDSSAPERAALRAIEAQAAELDVGMVRLALAWLLSWRNDVVPVPGTRNPAHLEMNASASDIYLAPDARIHLAELFPP